MTRTILAAMAIGLMSTISYGQTENNISTNKSAAPQISTGRLPLVNVTGVNLIPASVTTSCSGLKANVTPEITLPNDTAWINFSFDPTGMEADCEKTITISWDGMSDDTKIDVSSIVKMNDKSMMRRFPISLNENVELSTDTITLELEKNPDKCLWPVKVYNGYDDREIIMRLTEVPEWVHGKVIIEKVRPGMVGVITLEAFPEKAKKLGELYEINGVILDGATENKISDLKINLKVIPKPKKKKN